MSAACKLHAMANGAPVKMVDVETETTIILTTLGELASKVTTPDVGITVR